MSKNSQTTILLVDDEPNILVPLEFLMKKEGYRTLTAGNGRAALKILKKEAVQIVLLDVMMPEMNGFEVAQTIRNTPGLEQTRIIFLTAKGTKEDKMKGYSNGGEVYLTKPFDNQELIDTVNEVVEFG